MPIELSSAVILFLRILILVLLFIVIKLNIQFYKDKKTSKKKINFLKVHVVHANNNRAEQLEKIKLSEELKYKLKTINSKLNSDIFDLNYKIFEEIYPKK